jgi:hypothetical protein
MKNKKKKYTRPIIEKIKLDKTISIQMQSPPGDPFEQPDPYIDGSKDKLDKNPFG